MHVVVVQQPSATASVGVPVAVPPTVQVYAIRAPVGVANTTSALSLSAESATSLSPRHLASLNAIYSASNDLTTGNGCIFSSEKPTIFCRLVIFFFYTIFFSFYLFILDIHSWGYYTDVW